MTEHDVAIVGAGPGGSLAARTSAELGLDTIFFERGKEPGAKNSSGCGLGQRWWRDFPEVMSEVSSLSSFRKVEMVVVNVVDENDRLRYRSGTTGSDLDAARYSYDGEARGMQGASVYRRDLDTFLADMAVDAGAELRTSTLITDLIKKGGEVSGVETEDGEKFSADVVIGADGAFSTVARKSGLRNRWGEGITLCPQLDFSADEEKLDDFIGNSEWVWFGPFCGAYQVVFRDGFHLGAGQWIRSYEEKPRGILKRVMKIPAFKSMVRLTDAKPREYQAHMLPWMEEPRKSFADGVMLVGDAAGFPCPLEGEGVWHACLSGRIAAEVAEQAIEEGDTSEERLQEYERRWRSSPLGREHEFGEEFVNIWKASIFDPELMKGLTQLLLEFSMVDPFAVVFDWGDSHMDVLNQHIEHLVGMLPEYGEWLRDYASPLLEGISSDNIDRILELSIEIAKSRASYPSKVFFKIVPDRVLKKMIKSALGG